MKKRIITDKECYEVDLECLEKKRRQERQDCLKEFQKNQKPNRKGAR